MVTRLMASVAAMTGEVCYNHILGTELCRSSQQPGVCVGVVGGFVAMLPHPTVIQYFQAFLSQVAWVIRPRALPTQFLFAVCQYLSERSNTGT
jgi:hypothetical protein